MRPNKSPIKNSKNEVDQSHLLKITSFRESSPVIGARRPRFDHSPDRPNAH